MSVGFFVFILELGDLFGNLWKYMSLNVPVLAILKVMLLYIPTCLVWALPIALLFAISFALGNLYASNELVAIFGTGISLGRFSFPLLIVAALFSVGSFFFSDFIALPAYRAKKTLVSTLLNQNPGLSNSDVTVLSKRGSVVYHASFYDDSSRSLSGLNIIERNPEGQPIARTEASSAQWQEEKWLLLRVRRFALESGIWSETDFGTYSNPSFDESPQSFRNQNLDLAELSVAELGDRASFQTAAGLPFAATVAERHRRLAFSFAPLIVALLSVSIGGRYRKNVLLMSLLVSLAVSTAYYVFQMVTILLAKTGVLDPALGAWSPLIVFAFFAAVLYRLART